MMVEHRPNRKSVVREKRQAKGCAAGSENINADVHATKNRVLHLGNVLGILYYLLGSSSTETKRSILIQFDCRSGSQL